MIYCVHHVSARRAVVGRRDSRRGDGVVVVLLADQAFGDQQLSEPRIGLLS